MPVLLGMKTITATESELSRFFASEPGKLDEGIVWPYNQFSYEFIEKELSLSFTIQPAERFVEITLKNNGRPILELTATEFEDLLYREEKNSETIELIIDQNFRVWFRLRPQLQIIQEGKPS